MIKKNDGRKTFSIRTFGCKLNQYDSQVLREQLQALGMHRAETGQSPDICIFNTCTVTHVADQKARQAIRRAAGLWPDALIYVVGCGPVRNAGEFAAVKGVHRVFEPKRRPEMLLEVANDLRLPFSGPNPGLCSGITTFAGHGRALLKIQEGCNGGCSYCIVPLVRGRPVTRPEKEILEEAKRLAESGFEEIILTGTHIGLFGSDVAAPTSLERILRALLDTLPSVRFRLSSLEVMELALPLVEVVAQSGGRVCPHFHLPLQSGDDGVLRAMRRPYSTSDFQRRIELLKTKLTKPAITTDVIVGFPGEGPEAFKNTFELSRSVGFSRMHVFPFSERPGTAAADMPGRPPSKEVKSRCRSLRGLADELAEAFALKWLGTVVEIVPERFLDSRICTGYTERYIPATADVQCVQLRKRTSVVASAFENQRLKCVSIPPARSSD